MKGTATKSEKVKCYFKSLFSFKTVDPVMGFVVSSTSILKNISFFYLELKTKNATQ